MRTETRSRVLITLAMALMLAAPVAAFAGGRVGFQGGATLFAGGVEVDRNGEKIEAETPNGASFAVDGGWKATDSLEIGGLVQIGGDFSDSTTFSATAGPRYSFLDKDSRARPFVVGQLGYYNVGVSYPNTSLFDIFGPTEDEGGVGFNLGGGLDYYPIDWMSVGADVRYHRAFVFDGVDYFTTMLGASFHFG